MPDPSVGRTERSTSEASREAAALFLLIETLLGFPARDRRRLLELVRRGVRDA